GGFLHAAGREAAQRAGDRHVPAARCRVPSGVVGGAVGVAEDRAELVGEGHGPLPQQLAALVGMRRLGQIGGVGLQVEQAADQSGARGGEPLARAAPVRVLLAHRAPLLGEGLRAGGEGLRRVIGGEVVLADPLLDHVEGIADRHRGTPQAWGRGTTTSSGRTKVRSGSISLTSFFSTSRASRVASIRAEVPRAPAASASQRSCSASQRSTRAFAAAVMSGATVCSMNSRAAGTAARCRAWYWPGFATWVPIASGSSPISWNR